MFYVISLFQYTGLKDHCNTFLPWEFSQPFQIGICTSSIIVRVSFDVDWRNICGISSMLFYFRMLISVNLGPVSVRASVLKPRPLTHWGWDNMAAILQMTFSNPFSCVRKLYFNSNFTGICSCGSNLQLPSIGAGNGLVTNRWQAITWNNHGLVYSHISISRPGWVNSLHAKFLKGILMYICISCHSSTLKWHR